MRVNGINQTTFGVKVPTRRVLESATGVFFDEARVSHPAQASLLQKVGNLTNEQLYSYHMGEAMINMSKIMRERYPKIAQSAQRIKKECEIINKDRTFLPKDEIKVGKRLNKVVDEELEKIGTKEMDVAPMSLEELGYDKSRIIAEANGQSSSKNRA